jgi:hypothetical protein
VGVTIQEIHDHFSMDFYSVRMVVRKLLLRNVIDSNKIDLGRQQSLKYVKIEICSHHHPIFLFVNLNVRSESNFFKRMIISGFLQSVTLSQTAKLILNQRSISLRRRLSRRFFKATRIKPPILSIFIQKQKLRRKWFRCRPNLN